MNFNNCSKRGVMENFSLCFGKNHPPLIMEIMNNDHSLNPVDFTNLLISECTEDNGTKWCLIISAEQQNILKSELMKHNKINNTIPIYLLQRSH